MVVDDQKDILTVLTRSLAMNTITVHAFDNPVVALEHIKAGCQDCWLLISDVRMPQMSGFEFVKKAKQLRPDLRILLMTAFEINKQEFQKVLPSVQVDDFIQKPARTDELVEIINRYQSIKQVA